MASPIYTAGFADWLKRPAASDDDRCVVVTRDPRDIIVSLVLSLALSHTPNEVTSILRLPIRHANKEDRIRIGIHLFSHWAAQFRSWFAPESDDDILRLDYADLVADEQAAFRRIFAYLGWEIPDEVATTVINTHSFLATSGGRRRGEENEFSHRRKGISGDWQNHFSRQTGEMFETSFPGLLAYCGYEQGTDWWTGLPEESPPDESAAEEKLARLLAAYEAQEKELAIQREAAAQRLRDVETLHQLYDELRYTTQNLRITSLDQFRGYTVAGMFLVNFLSSYKELHPLLRHHNTYNSYADTIMPHFFFAVGFALQLGSEKPVPRLVKRAMLLMMVAALVYWPTGGWRIWFQTLTHIAFTTLWILPVLRSSVRTQVIFMVCSSLLHVGLSAWFWHDWLRAQRVIDGGPLGFLTWTIPTIMGAIACRWYREGTFRPMVSWGIGLMLVGYGLSCLSQGGVWAAPPFVAPWHARDMWTMSQQAASASYLYFSAGFSLLVYRLFVWWDPQIPLFRTLGTNALAGYILAGYTEDLVKYAVPGPWWLSFSLFFALTWGVLLLLERKGWYLRL